MTRRLPDVSGVQRGRASRWDFDKSMSRGDVCVVALVRQSNGQGTWRFDRIARLGKGPVGRGKEIIEVESGLPITLNRPEAWDGERHWFTYALDTSPQDIRAADLWRWWVEEGRPSWRWPSQIKPVIRSFFVEQQEAA
jgi:hypothetical protein